MISGMGSLPVYYFMLISGSLHFELNIHFDVCMVDSSGHQRCYYLFHNVRGMCWWKHLEVLLQLWK